MGRYVDLKNARDPYKTDAEWKSAAFKDKDSWVTEIAVPFSNFQIGPKNKDIWYMNFARERKDRPEETLLTDVPGMTLTNLYRFQRQTSFTKTQNWH